jgi:hypothetical protein
VLIQTPNTERTKMGVPDINVGGIIAVLICVGAVLGVVGYKLVLFAMQHIHVTFN